MSCITCLQIDAFTSRPFGGNPAAVCLLLGERDAGWMQRVAAEMNLSETAFVRPKGTDFELRWFTPLVEVDLCGHATLASAHALWQTGGAEPVAPIRFLSRSGPLVATRRAERIELDFPGTPAKAAEPPAGMLEALGATAQFVGRTRFDYLVELAGPNELRALRPDFVRLRQTEARGVIVTSTSDDPRFDFLSRFFAPGAGIDEDPVTGSAHCCLAPYWQARFGKEEMTGYQASVRGGVVHVRVAGDRVILGGQAVTVWTGELTAEATK